MKKEMTFTEQNTSYNDLSRLFKDVNVWLHVPAEWLRNYYSAILEREVSSQQAAYITQAQIAFVLSAFPIMTSIWLHIIAILWLIRSLWMCKRG